MKFCNNSIGNGRVLKKNHNTSACLSWRERDAVDTKLKQMGKRGRMLIAKKGFECKK